MAKGKKGLFITFEGIEGCGKSTQVKLLERRLKRLHIPLVVTREPGGTPIGKTIRKTLLDARNTAISPLAEWLLYAADRAQHVKEVIRPGLLDGKWVVCDRFMDATEAYQGRARGQDTSLIRAINEVVIQGMRPDLTFLLDLPVEIGLERALRRNSATNAGRTQDRFEREQLSFHRKVRKAYLELARREMDRFVVLDADAGEKEVEEAVFRHIEPLLKRCSAFRVQGSGERN
jgi:dTMP kinase